MIRTLFTSLLVCLALSICYASDDHPPPVELLGYWRLTEIETTQNHYTELSDCGLAKVSIKRDPANEFYSAFGFLLRTCLSDTAPYQCFTSPEPGVLTEINATADGGLGLSCAIIGGGSVCTYIMEPDELQWQCEFDNLSHEECVEREKRYRKTNFCINERRSLESRQPLSMSIPEKVTGYQFVGDQLMLFGNDGEKMRLQRHEWLPGLKEEEPTTD